MDQGRQGPGREGPGQVRSGGDLIPLGYGDDNGEGPENKLPLPSSSV